MIFYLKLSWVFKHASNRVEYCDDVKRNVFLKAEETSHVTLIELLNNYNLQKGPFKKYHEQISIAAINPNSICEKMILTEDTRFLNTCSECLMKI